MTKRGRNLKGVVIHNDAGTMILNYITKFSKCRLLRRNIATHAYAGCGIWEAISEDRIAWHVYGVQPDSGNFET